MNTKAEIVASIEATDGNNDSFTRRKRDLT